MNIVLLNTYSIFGGAARACYRLHQGFRSEGHESELLVRHHHGATLDGVQICGGSRKRKLAQHDFIVSRIRGAAIVDPESTYFSPLSPNIIVGRNKVLAQADAINIHWVADFLSPRDLRGLLNLAKPVVWTLHDARAFTGGCHYPGDCREFQHNCEACPQLQKPFQFLASTGLRITSGIFGKSATPAFVTPSAWLARLAVSSPFLANARIEVIPYSLDLDVYKPSPTAFVPRNKFVVLFGAHSIKDRRKGVDLVLEAINHCLRQRDISEMIQDERLVFACFGEAQAIKDAKELPIHMLGSFSDDESAARIYRDADVFICPSREDNLPNTVMEAMACGVAVLGTKVGGIPDMVEDGLTGRLVPSGDAVALADALLDLIRNKDKARSMGAAGREKSERLYAPSRQVESYLRLFEDLSAQSVAKSARITLRDKLHLPFAERRARKELQRV